jgi:hypothetical protein
MKFLNTQRFYCARFNFENHKAEILAILALVKMNQYHQGILHLRVAAYLKQKDLHISSLIE